jgi:gamma-butyrobetaine dioxygenase
VGISITDGGLRLDVPAGARHLPFEWLRENCHCSRCRHPEAHERTLDMLSLPDRAAARRIEAHEGSVSIIWEADGHASSFSVATLAELSMPSQPPAPEPWTGAELERPRRFALAELGRGTPAFGALIGELARRGVALIDGVADRDGEVVEVARRFGHPWSHHFGSYFEVVASASPDSLAYTDLTLPPHTDLPSRLSPPGLQLLHCRRASADGGASVLVDGWALVERLRRVDRDAYDALCTLPVTFRFHNATGDYRWSGPMLQRDDDGRPVLFRFNTFLVAPPVQAHDAMRRVRGAIRRVLEECARPGVATRLRLVPGEVLVMDNWRLLHGRDAYRDAARRLEGCYLDRDELLSRVREVAADHRGDP